MLTSKKEIKEWLETYSIENYTINENLVVDVHENVDLSNLRLFSFHTSESVNMLPVKFGKIDGDFDCSSNSLTTLQNCPYEVTGNFYCYSNKLKNLKYCPQTIGCDFDCSNNLLHDILDCPKNVGNDIDISNNYIQSLKGLNEIIHGSLNCSGNLLKNLKGCPKEVKESFYCSNNQQLTNLEYAPLKIHGGFYCYRTPIKTLNNFKSELGENFTHSGSQKIIGFESFYTEQESTIGKESLLLFSATIPAQSIKLFLLKESLEENLENDIATIKQRKKKI